MDFMTLLKNVSVRLKIIARRYHGRCLFVDREDLYQEMCIHLWHTFGDGKPDDKNLAYIAKSCEFHILNYIRRTKDKASLVSLDKPIGQDGCVLGDFLPDTKMSLEACVETRIILQEVENRGLTKREKEVFLLLAQGYTVREAGERLGISHVRVVKIKKNIIEKCQRKKKEGYQKQGF